MHTRATVRKEDDWLLAGNVQRKGTNKQVEGTGNLEVNKPSNSRRNKSSALIADKMGGKINYFP